MKNSKWMWVVLAIGLAVGCQRSVGASLLGTCEQIAAEQNGTYEPQTMEDQLMVLVAKDIAATLPGGSDYVSPIVSDPACVPTGVITYTTAVVFVPAADELSVTTYTVHGVPVVVTVKDMST